jgi:hypothetical protein
MTPDLMKQGAQRVAAHANLAQLNRAVVMPVMAAFIPPVK